MPEILPSSSDGTEERLIRQRTPDSGSVETLVVSGPKGAIETLEAQYNASVLNGSVAGTVAEYARGRGNITVSFIREATENPAVQMLYSMDLIRDIYAAPYFAVLTDTAIGEVRDVFESQPREAAPSGWSEKQKQLYGHLLRGQDSYYETAYEFRQVWSTGSQQELRIAATGINTVQTLPTLNTVMRRLIGDLPTGEWLKKPTVMYPVGKGLYQVEETYHWAVKWSVVYGGTFTGTV